MASASACRDDENVAVAMSKVRQAMFTSCSSTVQLIPVSDLLNWGVY